MITTLTQWRLVVYFSNRIAPTGGDPKKKRTKRTPISPNVARDIFSIIPHGVGVEASFSLPRDVIGWRQSKTRGETLREKVIVRRFAQANSGLLAGDDPVLDPDSTDNNMEMKREAEEKKLHTMAKVNNIMEMWLGTQTLRATQEASRA